MYFRNTSGTDTGLNLVSLAIITGLLSYHVSNLAALVFVLLAAFTTSGSCGVCSCTVDDNYAVLCWIAESLSSGISEASEADVSYLLEQRKQWRCSSCLKSNWLD